MSWLALFLVLAQAPGITAEAPIVGGNVVSAKERAMADAFRQAVERSYGALLAEAGIPEPLPPGLVKLRDSFLTGARTFVRSWRLLDQTEEGGRVRVQVEVEVKEAELRKEIERGRAGTAVTAPVPSPRRPMSTSMSTSMSMPGSVMVTGSPPEAVLSVVRSLLATGLKTEAPPVGAVEEPRARELAVSVGATAAVLVSAAVTPEGQVRGTSKWSSSCRLGLRVIPLGGGLTMERVAESRAFAGDDEVANGECLGRVTAELVPHVIETLKPGLGAASYGRTVVLDLEMNEPAVLPIALQALRKVAAVSAVEVRRVTVGRVELRVATRLPAHALIPLLAREAGGALAIRATEAGPDRAALQVRMAGSAE